MSEACSSPDCDNNALWKFSGEFYVDDDPVDVILLCKDHYARFIDTADLDLLQSLMSAMNRE